MNTPLLKAAASRRGARLAVREPGVLPRREYNQRARLLVQVSRGRRRALQATFRATPSVRPPPAAAPPPSSATPPLLAPPLAFQLPAFLCLADCRNRLSAAFSVTGIARLLLARLLFCLLSYTLCGVTSDELRRSNTRWHPKSADARAFLCIPPLRLLPLASCLHLFCLPR